MLCSRDENAKVGKTQLRSAFGVKAAGNTPIPLLWEGDKTGGSMRWRRRTGPLPCISSTPAALRGARAICAAHDFKSRNGGGSYIELRGVLNAVDSWTLFSLFSENIPVFGIYSRSDSARRHRESAADSPGHNKTLFTVHKCFRVPVGLFYETKRSKKKKLSLSLKRFFFCSGSI